MSSSSHTRCCTTVSAVPSKAGSKLSSPSRLASETITVAMGGNTMENKQHNMEKTKKFSLTSCSSGNALEVFLFAPPHTHTTSLNKVLETEVIDPTSGEHHIGTSCQDLGYPLLGDVRLPSNNNNPTDSSMARSANSPLSNGSKLCWVINHHRHTKMHFCLLEAEIKTGDLCLIDSLWHCCMGNTGGNTWEHTCDVLAQHSHLVKPQCN